MPATNDEPKDQTTHGMCAECLAVNFPDEFEEVNTAVNGPADLNAVIVDLDLGFWPQVLVYVSIGMLLFFSALLFWRLVWLAA